MELLVECINDIIGINYPKIKTLTNYLKNIAKILNELKLPIIWRLPHGLMISQKYTERKGKCINHFSYLKTSLTLTITDKDKMFKTKQITSLMPNLVHSLDACTLTL